MNAAAAQLVALSLLAFTSAHAQSPSTPAAGAAGAQAITIARKASRPSAAGPAKTFTGSVRIDPLIDAPAPARTFAGNVTFEPGARTHWHSHPLGQNLIVTSGSGLVQAWGAPVQAIGPGDVIWTPPGVKHWHGASPTTAMTHIAIVEKLDGKSAEWMEPVTDEQYRTP